ncbi:MAG: aminodeoxychorismate/anthranilate synthase component II [Bacteroidales bacterium]|nr:aminodeoxychorismate/anthranilate synthase component II [Bacteroidales bacterium]
MPSNSRILIIDNNDSFTFNLFQLVEEGGGWSCEVVRSDILDPEIVSGFDKILISPGPGLPDDFPRMCRVIGQFGPEKDILGICLGHQAIAMQYGGTLVNMTQVKHGVTTTLNLRNLDHRLFEGVEEGSRVGLYHSWTVDPNTLPDCLEITAVGDDGSILALRHKSFSVRGVQFHPESFMTPAGRMMITNWLAGE